RFSFLALLPAGKLALARVPGGAGPQSVGRAGGVVAWVVVVVNNFTGQRLAHADQRGRRFHHRGSGIAPGEHTRQNHEPADTPAECMSANHVRASLLLSRRIGSHALMPVSPTAGPSAGPGISSLIPCTTAGRVRTG